MTKKNGLSGCRQEEILALAEKLHGIKKINAYNLAGRKDLAYEAANEVLEFVGVSYGRKPEIYQPYDEDRWEVLRDKKEFDKLGILYDNEIIRESIKNSKLSKSIENPTIKEIKNLEKLLEENGLDEIERKEFFNRARKEAGAEIWSDEIYAFCYEGKETGYSNLAKHTGVSRKEIVNHYLDGVFKDVDDLAFHPEKLTRLIKREKIDDEEIISRVKNAKFDGRDKISHKYYLVKNLSEDCKIQFSKDLVIDIIRDYVESGGCIDEIYGFDGPRKLAILNGIENDEDIAKLRIDSLKNAIECNNAYLLDNINYAINKFKIDPNTGWLNKALKEHMKNWIKSDYTEDMSKAAIVGKRFNLLSKDEIKQLKRKIKLINLLDKD